MLVALFVLVFGLMSFTVPTYAQPSSAPPSSLPVTPLSPTVTDPTGIGSCDLCRPLEGRRGSDLQRHRARQDRDLHPHKKAPGVTKSMRQSFQTQLPHRKLEGTQEGSER